jgi:hypothetical protein
VEVHLVFDASSLADLSLPDPDGRTTRLGDLWTEERHLLLFLRHFG